MSAIALRRRAAVAAPEAAILGALALAMALCTTWAAIAAGWNEGMSLALATTTIAVLEAVLLASSTAGRVTAAIAAPVLGLLVIVPTTIGGMPAARAGESGGLGHVVREYAGAFTGGLLGETSWAFIVGFCGGMWICGFFGAWTAVRERRGFIAALPFYGVLASNAINAPRLGAVAVPSLLAMGFSLILLTRTTLSFLEQRWRGERVVALPGTRRRFGRIALAAAAAITFVAAVFPPLTSTDISGKLFPFNVSSGGGHGVGSGGGATQQQATIHFSPNTEPGGALTVNPQPVLAYTLDSDETLYLRVIDDTVFQAGNWYPSERSRTLLKVPVDGGRIPRDRTPADGGVTNASKSEHAHIVFSATATSVGDVDQVPFPGEPDSVDHSVTVHGDASANQELLTVDHVDLPAGVGTDSTLNVIGTIPVATEEQLRNAGNNYPDWLQAGGYTELTVLTASERQQLADIRSLARNWTQGLTNAYDEARAIERNLRAAPFVYTLKPPAARPNEWPIHAFLIDNHRGYCQYFASSMGTMLRTLGIPTRLVTGYGPGTVDDLSGSGRAQLLHRVSTSDAHVWVEAYFPQFGWIPFEPTPSSSDGDYQPIVRPLATGATPSPSAASATPTPSPSPTPTPRSDAGAAPVVPGPTSGPPAALLAVVFGLVGILVVVGWSISWLLRPRTLRALWKRMVIIGALLGTRRGPTETLGAYCERLAGELPGERENSVHRDWLMTRDRAVEDLQVIGTLSGKAAFSTKGLLPAEVTRWRRAWRGLVRLMPRLLVRRLARSQT